MSTLRAANGRLWKAFESLGTGDLILTMTSTTERVHIAARLDQEERDWLAGVIGNMPAGAGGSVDPPAADAADAPATPPAPRKPGAHSSPVQHEDLHERVVETMRKLGAATPHKVAVEMGEKVGRRSYYAVREHMLWLVLDRQAVADGASRGRPCYRYASPDAAVASDDTSPAPEPSPGAAAAGDDTSPGSPSDASPAPGRRRSTPTTAVADPLEHRTTRAREQAEMVNNEMEERMLAELAKGPATIRDLAAALGVKSNQLTSRRVGLERRGRITWRKVKPGTTEPMYERVPLPHEVEGMEISTSDPEENGTVQGRVLQALLLGAKNVPELAAELEVHPAIAAQAVSKLQREGEVVKQPGGKYLRVAV